MSERASASQKRSTRMPGGVLAVALATLTVAGVAHPGADATARPTIAMRCELELCTTSFSYVLPERDDDHLVELRLESTAAPGLEPNAADVVVRELRAGVGDPLGGAARGYRYVVSDVVWHSDIRCDRSVRVTAHGPAGTATRMVTKQVPGHSESAFCSAYGMS